MKVLRALLLTACLILGTTSVNATSRNHQRAIKSTFVLYGRSVSRGMDHRAFCTAWVSKKVSDGYILTTAGHCFSPNAPEDAVYLVAEGQAVDNPVLQPVEVLNHVDNGKMDVAEVHLKTGKKYPVLEMEKNPTKIDDKVFYVGYPEMVAQVVSTGRIESGIMQSVVDENDPCDICVGRFLVQTGGGPGASGSPVISERTGRVVGILEGHVFENGVVVVPAPSVESYYQKVGHAQVEKPKNDQSEEKSL